MCMLSYLPPGIESDEEELENGALVNPDGHGWAIVNADQRTISVRRSMKYDEALSTFTAERAKNLSGPAIFHSRIATSGNVDITGVHPFHVGDDRRTVLGHNGILFDPPKGSTKSDTRIFAERILPLYGCLDNDQNIKQLEVFAGWYNKLVILTVNPSYRKNAYLINGDQGHWSTISGIWHSTYDYEPYTKWSKGKVYNVKSNLTLTGGWKSEAADWDEPGDGSTSPWPCSMCGAFNTVDMFTMVCSMCRSCTECEMFVEECQCYTPDRHRYASEPGKMLEVWRESIPVLGPKGDLRAIASKALTTIDR